MKTPNILDWNSASNFVTAVWVQKGYQNGSSSIPQRIRHNSILIHRSLPQIDHGLY